MPAWLIQLLCSINDEKTNKIICFEKENRVCVESIFNLVKKVAFLSYSRVARFQVLAVVVVVLYYPLATYLRAEAADWLYHTIERAKVCQRARALARFALILFPPPPLARSSRVESTKSLTSKQSTKKYHTEAPVRNGANI